MIWSWVDSTLSAFSWINQSSFHKQREIKQKQTKSSTIIWVLPGPSSAPRWMMKIILFQHLTRIEYGSTQTNTAVADDM